MGGPQPHFQIELRVYWEDTDAGGIVFYGNYLKFMERARSDWLRALGFSQEAMRQQGEGMFVVTRTALDYERPARLDDVLRVTVTLAIRGRASLSFTQEVWRDAERLARGEIRVGWVSPDGEGRLRPARLPAEVVAALPTPAAEPPGSSH